MNSLHKPRTWVGKFAAAMTGLGGCCKSQSSMRVHLACGGLVVVLAVATGLEPCEWALLLLAVGLVLGIELMNTAIEALVDLVSPDYSELARVAKDTAAGAVLMAAITAISVGGCVFIPHWRDLLGF